MTSMSFMDKVNVLINITKSSRMFIFVIVSLFFLALLFLTTNKKNYKGSKIIYISIYVIVLASLLFTYRQSLSSMFDYLMNNLFIVIYFPNLAIYLVAIVISNIILWMSLFNGKTNKIIRIINVVIYCVMTYVLILILNVINLNKLDIFNQTSIYGNSDALALIELSSVIFVGWICFLIIYKIIRIIQTSKEPEVIEEEKLVPVKPYIDLPKNLKLVEAPSYIKTNKPQVKVERKEDVYGNLLTLDDYKLLLNILSNHKIKTQNDEILKMVETAPIKPLEKPKMVRLTEEKHTVVKPKVVVSKPKFIKPVEKIEILDVEKEPIVSEETKFQQLKDLYSVR